MTSEPSAADLRAAVETQMCPWCDAGPFKLLTAHTAKAHGIDRVEYRARAGMRFGDSTIAESERQGYAERGLSLNNVSRGDRGAKANRERSAAVISICRLAAASAAKGEPVDPKALEALMAGIGDYMRARIRL